VCRSNADEHRGNQKETKKTFHVLVSFGLWISIHLNMLATQDTEKKKYL
jgi:hypothetical protein